MANKFLPAVPLLVLLWACGDDASNHSTSGTHASPNADKNVAAVPDFSINTADHAAARAPFKNIMDITMQDMHTMQMTNDPDQDFALLMKRHHQAAIEMANLEITKGEREVFKKLARSIMHDARNDINDLNSFISNHKPVKQADFTKKIMERMMKNASNAQWNDSSATDWQFFALMSLHHRQGIELAKAYLPYASQDQTKKMAQRIIKSNEADISKLNDAVLAANEKAEASTKK